MHIPLIGPLHPDAKIPEWLVSGPLPIPYFDGLEVPFILESLTDADRADATEAIGSFLSLGRKDRLAASRYVFELYRRIAAAVDGQDLGCDIQSKESVWQHIQPTEVRVVRRNSGDREVYVQIAAECDWEPEHGLQIVYRRGAVLARVSDQDGHLTHTDAYGLAGSEHRIVAGLEATEGDGSTRRRSWWKFW